MYLVYECLGVLTVTQELNTNYNSAVQSDGLFPLKWAVLSWDMNQTLCVSQTSGSTRLIR